MHNASCLIVCAWVCVAGRWEARIGIPAKVYLGLFSMETEAAQAYDRALVRLRGTAAATNFALSDYRSDLAAYHKMQQVHTPSPVLCLLSSMCRSTTFDQQTQKPGYLYVCHE